MLDRENRVEFTREMKDTYTILIPNMADIHFRILKNIFLSYGYRVELLTGTGREIIDEGLKYVHNDTCYPALLTIGQMISALKSGKYDVNHTALVMSQTGGGCRASNYIHLLRKALLAAGMPQVPVISLSLAGLEKNSGFRITLPMVLRALAAITYGDLLMLLRNQTRPYELETGASDREVERWIQLISREFERGHAFTAYELKSYFRQIVTSFAAIPLLRREKTKVGIVGEIYVKYSPLANNHLEDFLASQDCEVMIPGILNFVMYCLSNTSTDIALYGGSRIKSGLAKIGMRYLLHYERLLNDAVHTYSDFVTPAGYRHLQQLGQKIIGPGCKMGEGWLLTAEIMELTEMGYENIVCAQPFGCLPNHIVGRGMTRKIREHCPAANIVAIDYDPGATKVNQENRIKLMLAVAREKLPETLRWAAGGPAIPSPEEIRSKALLDTEKAG
jgi:predicted nucleotide-binding protein (sugar kinase/HSP70/actin superfamily)